VTVDLSGPAAPPRRNGELVFAAPWESRVFGITLALQEAGLFGWDEFRERLIAAIAAQERGNAGWSYYACWAGALEALLAARGICSVAELDVRAERLAMRAPGHDHRR